MRALATIKYSELVADLLGACLRIELLRKRKDPRLGMLIDDTRRLLADTIKFQEDMKCSIEGIDFQTVVRRVRLACGDEPAKVGP
jgi:hypothetical protein